MNIRLTVCNIHQLEVEKLTKSTPVGSWITHLTSKLSSWSWSYIVRTIDKDIKGQGVIYKESHEHKGSSFIEVYQAQNI